MISPHFYLPNKAEVTVGSHFKYEAHNFLRFGRNVVKASNLSPDPEAELR